MKATLFIAFTAMRELIHEKIFYILVLFCLSSLCLSALLAQFTFAEQLKLTVDFMLVGIELSMVLLSVFMGVSFFRREILTGSVLLVLARPIPRRAFLLGKYFGQMALQVAVALVMGATIGLLCVQFLSSGYLLSVVQCTLLLIVEAAILTAITYCFAVNTGVLTTVMISLVFFVLGHLHPLFDKWVKEPLARGVWYVTSSVVPNLEVLNMKPLTAYGHIFEWNIFLWAVLYGLLCVIFFLTIAVVTFEQKDILT